VTSVGSLVSSYISPLNIVFQEDFEGLSIGWDTTQRSTKNIIKTNNINYSKMLYGHVVGEVDIDTAHSFFECQTHKEYIIPTVAPLYLEMDFNTDNALTVGIITYSNANLYQIPVITLNPTNNKWKKIYIDLSTSLWTYSGVTTFRVYMGTFIDSGKLKSTILFDNFKVLQR